MSQSAHAATHVWIPAPGAGAQGVQGVDGAGGATVNSTQQVVIIGSRIFWGPGTWDVAFNEVPNLSSFNGLSAAINSARERAVDLADVCRNPLISASFKGVKSTSDTTERWLAATATFNSIQMQRLWTMYQGAYGGISIIIDNKSYTGFKVKYADGGTETWVVNPGHTTSSVKLFDTPAPDSLKVPSNPRDGCQG